MTGWVVVQPFNVSPDEGMRYKIVEYLVQHNFHLPHGGDPEIRDALWGISYAFNPILAYQLAAVPAKVVSLLTKDAFAILVAARMVNVALGSGMALLVSRIGKRLFGGCKGWMFAFLVMFLPGVLFVFSYVNNDGLALFSTALMILMWVRSLEDDWSWKTCTGLAIGVSLCALSYYNAYGVLLCSVVMFGITILLCREQKGDIRFLVTRGAVIIGIVLVLAGWWFVRSYMIYDGDILGMRASSEYAEAYARWDLKPSNRVPMSDVMSLPGMVFFVPGQWAHNWLVTVLVSFVGTFGYMTIFMPFFLSVIYISFIVVGLACVLLALKKTFWLGGFGKVWRREGVFHWCMLAAGVIPVILLVYYAYCSDFQAQGRYLLPGIIPVMYFVTYGYGNILDKVIKEKSRQMWWYMMIMILILGGALYTYFGVFLPVYM
jgi:hypothetical protein